ncbi:MAG: acyl-ACP--UDP-N-acetylglucosamine O-acyltransferase [Verrucomicrobia bacterium]|nr:acyl-ACP--UDP-N-acetylglucosamine O-acyltransferase [Verrucomicrobiota bacterium]
MSATIHPTAVIHPTAQIADGCEVGPYCVVGEQSVMGAGCKLHSHVVIESHTVLGQRNEVFPFACLGGKTQDLKWKGGTTWVRAGDDNVFREHVTVHRATSDGAATVIGSHNLLLIHAHVAHDCVLHNHVILSGYAGLAGHVVIEDHAILSGFTAVHQFCRVGRLAITGGCSRITQDCPPFIITEGNPSEVRALNKIGLERHGVSEEAQAALKQAYRILFREGLKMSNALTKVEAEVAQLPEVQHLVQFIRSSERGIGK